MVGNIKISANILPFGCMKMTFVLNSEKPGEKERPVYIEPRSTSIEKIDILYEEAKEYMVPKTTDGH